jgi:SPP1 gp7 family putative phage head morphogenesis protein
MFDERREDVSVHLVHHAVAHHHAGLAQPRRAISRQLAPSAAMRDYTAALAMVMDEVRSQLLPLFDALPTLVVEARREYGMAPLDHPLDLSILGVQRNDGRAAARARELAEQARDRLTTWMNDARASGIAERAGRALSDFQREQLVRQMRDALGVDPLLLDRQLGARMRGWVHENIALIQDLPRSVVSQIEKAVLRTLTGAGDEDALAGLLARRLDVGDSRAEALARDQLGRLYGQLNADRQREAGITHFVWRTMRDLNVRPTHRRREGTIYAWSGRGAPSYLPGDEWGCRCWGEPVMDDVLSAIAAQGSRSRSFGLAPAATPLGPRAAAPAPADLPTWSSLGKNGKLVTVDPALLVRNGLDLSSITNESTAPANDRARIERAKQGLLEGKEAQMRALEPMEVVMNRNGDITDIVNGRHRIQAALELGRPITLRIGRAYEP